jgi:Domain of unknown function (DUF4352)/Protein of unknown function (DUF2510)
MSSPAGWYPDPAGSGSQRYFDGNQWTHHYAPAQTTLATPQYASSPQPKKPQTALIVTGVVGGLVILVILLGAIGSSVGNDKPRQSPASTPRPAASATAPAVVTPAAPTPTVLPRIGEEVRDGKFAFVVTSVDSSKVGGDTTNSFMQETAQGMYVNVHLRVTNIGDRPQTFFAANQKLRAQDQVFAADTMVAVWNGSATVEVNPGNTIDTVVSFDCPPGLLVSGVEVHDSMFSGGVVVSLEPV